MNVFGQSKNKEYVISFNSDKYDFSHSETENGFVDIYTLYQNDTLPKYLIYIMKSTYHDEFDVSQLQEENVQNLIADLNSEIISSKEVDYYSAKGIELKVRFRNKKQIVGFLFITSTGNNLIRFLVMMPTEEYYEKYYSESVSILKSFSLTQL